MFFYSRYDRIEAEGGAGVMEKEGFCFIDLERVFGQDFQNIIYFYPMETGREDLLAVDAACDDAGDFSAFKTLLYAFYCRFDTVKVSHLVERIEAAVEDETHRLPQLSAQGISCLMNKIWACAGKAASRPKNSIRAWIPDKGEPMTGHSKTSGGGKALFYLRRHPDRIV